MTVTSEVKMVLVTPRPPLLQFLRHLLKRIVVCCLNYIIFFFGWKNNAVKAKHWLDKQYWDFALGRIIVKLTGILNLNCKFSQKALENDHKMNHKSRNQNCVN